MGSSCLLQFAFTRTRISVFGSSVASSLLCVFYDRFCALLCFSLSITYVEASDDDFRETTFFFTKKSNMLKMSVKIRQNQNSAARVENSISFIF